jgi:hypothetical protein
MKHALVIILLNLIGTLTAIGQEKITNPKLQSLLDSMAVVDQQVQQEAMSATGEEVEKRIKKMNETFKSHTVLLKQIVASSGFPGFSQVGKEGSQNFWLLVQHSDDDPAFQKQVLRLMEKEVKKKNASARNYAYLLDRVNINSGVAQVYGTQLEYKNGKAQAKNLEDPKNVNQRRAKAGLEPLEEYLKTMTKLNQH